MGCSFLTKDARFINRNFHAACGIRSANPYNLSVSELARKRNLSVGHTTFPAATTMQLGTMELGTVTIVGAGLIGGSLGLALKQRGLARSVRGLGRQRQSLDRAQTLGAIDVGFVEPAPALRDADVVVFCTPVDRIAEQVLAFAPMYAPGALLTDAGSTKGTIVAAVEDKLPAGVAFVGGHPLAGSEKRGADYADANLFVGRSTVLTRTPRTDPAALAKISSLWQAVGARVVVMTPDDHDRALAVTSHLPHLVAAALAGILPAELAHLTASGFRDTTRIASGDPGLWAAIFAHNRDAVLTALEPFAERLSRLRTALAERDWPAVESLLQEAKKVRDALGS
jgi:prephenate dehydrogenase